MNPWTISVLVIIGRLLTPLVLFKFPVAGVFVNMIADTLDYQIPSHTGWGYYGHAHYQYIDKILDTYYLVFLLFLIRKWEDKFAARIGKILFFWRLAGVAIFEFTGYEHALVFAPNAMEYFYLIYVLVKKWKPEFQWTSKKLSVLICVLICAKILNEIYLHWLHLHWI